MAADVTADLRGVLDNLPDGILFMDREWRYTYLNRRAKEILERDGRELLDQNLWSMFSETVYEGAPYVENFYRTMNDRTYLWHRMSWYGYRKSPHRHCVFIGRRISHCG